jgi:hypothetical protein
MAAEEPGVTLWGGRAVEWLFARPSGPALFNRSIESVAESFGPDRGVSAFVPLGGAEAADFYLAVVGNVGEEQDWSLLVQAHLRLLESEERVVADPSAARERFHLILEPDPDEAFPLYEAVDRWLRHP